ncbi:MAG: hypothetical protein QOE42_1596, partial [Chloroflexota bacterium]|nr:hypothetical protein [Chloroflexota bacterium]
MSDRATAPTPLTPMMSHGHEMKAS